MSKLPTPCLFSFLFSFLFSLYFFNLKWPGGQCLLYIRRWCGTRVAKSKPKALPKPYLNPKPCPNMTTFQTKSLCTGGRQVLRRGHPRMHSCRRDSHIHSCHKSKHTHTEPYFNANPYLNPKTYLNPKHYLHLILPQAPSQVCSWMANKCYADETCVLDGGRGIDTMV